MPGEKDQAERLITASRRPDSSLVEALALGLLVLSKWDRIFHQEKQSGQPPTADEILKHADSFTTREVGNFRQIATKQIEEYVSRHSAPSVRWITGFGQAYWGAVAYSVTLAVLYVLAQFFGSDIVNIFQSLFHRA